MNQLETATKKQLAGTARSVASAIHELTQWLPYLEEIAKRLDDDTDLPEPSRASHMS